MTSINRKHIRVLSIAPSTRGFGFAVLEGQEKLVDWGAKAVKGDKNAQCLARVEKMVIHYQPDVMVLPDVVKNIRRSARIKELSEQIARLAETRRIKVSFLSIEQVRRRFFANGQGTKHALAKILAERYQEELGACLPPKRRLWMSEDRRMDIFDAVALALATRLRTTKRVV
jgi:hypothetical protein